jgi:hypothetical protein
MHALSMPVHAHPASPGEYQTAVGSRIGKNAERTEKINQLTSLKATVGHLVKNYCDGNPAALASWTAATHVESPPKKKPPTP